MTMNQPLKGKTDAVAQRHVLSISRFPWAFLSFCGALALRKIGKTLFKVDQFPSNFQEMVFEKTSIWRTNIVKRFLDFGEQTYTSEAAAIGFKIFRSITHQENTWTTRNKDSTQIYTGWTCTCANFTYNNLALRQINIRLNTHTSHTKKEERNKKVIPNSNSPCEPRAWVFEFQARSAEVSLWEGTHRCASRAAEQQAK